MFLVFWAFPPHPAGVGPATLPARGEEAAHAEHEPVLQRHIHLILRIALGDAGPGEVDVVGHALLAQAGAVAFGVEGEERLDLVVPGQVLRGQFR